MVVKKVKSDNHIEEYRKEGEEVVKRESLPMFQQGGGHNSTGIMLNIIATQNEVIILLLRDLNVALQAKT